MESGEFPILARKHTLQTVAHPPIPAANFATVRSLCASRRCRSMATLPLWLLKGRSGGRGRCVAGRRCRGSSPLRKRRPSSTGLRGWASRIRTAGTPWGHVDCAWAGQWAGADPSLHAGLPHGAHAPNGGRTTVHAMHACADALQRAGVRGGVQGPRPRVPAGPGVGQAGGVRRSPSARAHRGSQLRLAGTATCRELPTHCGATRAWRSWCSAGRGPTRPRAWGATPTSASTGERRHLLPWPSAAYLRGARLSRYASANDSASSVHSSVPPGGLLLPRADHVAQVWARAPLWQARGRLGRP